MMNCKRSCPQSAEIIGGNYDLLIELLSFLPSKSIARFQLVNKQWQSLISTPSFHHHRALRHHQPKPQVPAFLLRSYVSSPHDFFYYQPTIKKLIPLCFNLPFSRIRIMQCCNGLLLLEAKNKPRGRNDYFVFNPTTLQCRNLLIGTSIPQQLCLVFDPLISPHNYKVIRFTAKGLVRPRREYSIDVYESKTRTWKNWGNHCTNNCRIHNGIYWNGGMYFIRRNSYCFHLQETEGRVVDQVNKPPRVKGRSNYAVESNGHLHSISLSLQTKKRKYLYVFELKKEDHSWFEKYRVDIRPIAHMFADNNPQGAVFLGFVRGDMEGDSSFVFHEPGKLMLYKLKDRSLEVLVDFKTKDYYEEGRVQFRHNEFYQFIETLAPV